MFSDEILYQVEINLYVLKIYKLAKIMLSHNK